MSLSRTPAQEALDSVMVTPCFLSRPSAEAITTDAQSVSGMKPIFTSVFSGASVPAAQAPARTSGSTRDNRPAPVAARAAPASQLRRPASAPSRGSGFGACSERSWCDDMGMAPGKNAPPATDRIRWRARRRVPGRECAAFSVGDRRWPPLPHKQAPCQPPPPRARTGAKSVIPHGYWLDGRSTRARTDTLDTHGCATTCAGAQACARHAPRARRAAAARAAAWHGNCVITAIRICRIERPMLKVMLLNDGEDARRRCGRRWRPRACSSWPRPRRAWIWPQRSKTPLPMWC